MTRFTSHGRDVLTHAPMTQWERERMGAGFPDARPSLFDRHPFACTLAVIVVAVAVCFALLGVMPR